MKRAFSPLVGIIMSLVLLAITITGCTGFEPIPEEIALVPEPSPPPIAKPSPGPVPPATSGGACEGYTLYRISEPGNNALLIDMDGEIVHEWRIAGSPVKILPGGSLLGIKRIREDKVTSTSQRANFGGRNVPDAVECIQIGWDGQEEWSFRNWDDGGTGIMMSRQHHDYQREGNPVGYYAPG